MTELEQRLTNEFGKLAEQYAQEQKRLGRAGRALGRSGATIGRAIRRAGKQYAEWVNIMIRLEEDHLKMGAHITKLTDAYEGQAKKYDELISAYNGLVADLNELFR